MFVEKSKENSLLEVLAYTYPRLYVGKEWYVGFYAYDPARGVMRRKKIKINHIEGIRRRREYAADIMKRLTDKLRAGWNPWIESQNPKGFKLFVDAVEHFRNYVEKLYNEGSYREKTYRMYVSFLRRVEEYNGIAGKATYIYQFNREYIVNLLEWAFITRNNSVRTRNNYLVFLSVFSTFLVQQGYLTTKPTGGITSLREVKHKERDVIAPEDMVRLYEYLSKNNRHYLLACYILHYCFIRPIEMSKLRIENVSIRDCTIYVPGNISKNRKGQTVTMPKKVLMLMLDLDIFKNPSDWFLFSRDFKPGIEYRSEKQFTDYWSYHVRRDLKFPNSYKLYSLKDTGITNMLRKQDVVSVRDQARHSSISITDVYTPHDVSRSNRDIIEYEGDF